MGQDAGEPGYQKPHADKERLREDRDTLDTLVLLYIIGGTIWGGIWTFLAIGVLIGKYKPHGH